MTIAEVVLTRGRYFLVVRGVYVAMETDTCRDSSYDGPMWTRDTLRLAAADINAETFDSARERTKKKGNEGNK